MKNSLRFLWLVLVLLIPTYLCGVYGRLPDRLATHFDLSGNPNGWSGRSALVLLFVGLSLFTNLLLFVLYRWLHRLPDSAINLPHKTYWFSSPEKRAAGLEKLRVILTATGIFTSVVFLFSMHLVFLQARVVSFFAVPLNAGVASVGGLSVLLIIFSIFYTRPPR